MDLGVTDKVREVELKFDADPGAPLPDLSGTGGTVSEAVESQLDATYFDTADAQLARHGITLRRRTGGDDAGWHLKLPAGRDERIEVRLPLGRATSKVPLALAREVRALVRDRPLVPVAMLHTTRIERRLLDADGNALAAVADDTVHSERPTDGAVEVSTWREVEVELLEGNRSVLDAVSSRLQAAGMTPSRSSSKLARVLGDIPDPRRATAPGEMGRPKRATAGAVLLAHLGEQVDQLITRDRGARSDEPDAVHQMRVATRRLRSALATYRPLLERERTDPLRDELRWLGQLLGGSRDAEVLHWRLQDLVAAQPAEVVLGPVRRRVDLELRKRHRAANADLVAGLGSDRYIQLLDALDDLVANPPLTVRAGTKARNQLPALVGRAAGRVDRAARAAADAPTPQARDQCLHEVRKSAKRARYAAESATAVIGKPARRLADRMRALQDVLGEHQDSVASRALLLELAAAAHLNSENAFTYGLMHAAEGDLASEARRAYPPALRKASTTKTRRWTR
jgi:CHAD domain-containing protein